MTVRKYGARSRGFAGGQMSPSARWLEYATRTLAVTCAPSALPACCDRMNGSSISCAGPWPSTTGEPCGSQRAQPSSHAADIRRQLPTSGRLLAKTDNTFEKPRRDGGIRTRGLLLPNQLCPGAGRRRILPTWCRPALTMARRSLTPLRVCACWLPLWLPSSGPSQRRFRASQWCEPLRHVPGRPDLAQLSADLGGAVGGEDVVAAPAGR